MSVIFEMASDEYSVLNVKLLSFIEYFLVFYELGPTLST